MNSELGRNLLKIGTAIGVGGALLLSRSSDVHAGGLCYAPGKDGSDGVSVPPPGDVCYVSIDHNGDVIGSSSPGDHDGAIITNHDGTEVALAEGQPCFIPGINDEYYFLQPPDGDACFVNAKDGQVRGYPNPVNRKGYVVTLYEGSRNAQQVKPR